jgi:hypothetical protein
MTWLMTHDTARWRLLRTGAGPGPNEHGARSTPDPRPQTPVDPRTQKTPGPWNWNWNRVGQVGPWAPPWPLAPLAPGGSPLPTGSSGCWLWAVEAPGSGVIPTGSYCCLLPHGATRSTRYTPHATRYYTPPHATRRRAARGTCVGAWHCVGVGRYAICDMGTGTRGARRARGALEAPCHAVSASCC